MEFTCSECGQTHDVSELAWGAGGPAIWHQLSDEERSNSALSSDQCIIRCDGETHYFIRARLVIPVKGSDDTFEWGVWCSLSDPSFTELSEHWDDADQSKLGPYFGWFCTALPHYEDTMYLKTMVHPQDSQSRPLVQLERHDHQLCIDYHQGIEPERLQRLVTGLLHEAEGAAQST